MADSLRANLMSRLRKRLGLDFSFDLQRPRFSEIQPGLYVGAMPRPTDLGALRDLAITHVVSAVDERQLAELGFVASHFAHLRFALADDMAADVLRLLPTLFNFQEAMRPEDRLLIHCQLGVSRSATLAAALLMKLDRTTCFDAISLLREKRQGVLPNIGFASGLQRLEHQLLGTAHTGTPSSLARYLHEVCNAPVDLSLLEMTLRQNDYDAPRALRQIFGDEIPRVVQGVRSKRSTQTNAP